MRRFTWLVVPLFCLCLAATAIGAEPASDAAAGPHRVYMGLLEPREHPDYERRAVKPPSWDLFGNRTQFMALRGFTVKDQMIVDYAAELERYSRQYELGDVVWPSYEILFAKNLGDLADEIQRRGLYLFDVWGYVPGSGPGGYWQAFHPAPETFAMLEAKLGPRWLGTDNGEQDGRYIGGYSGEMSPSSASRQEQYFNFQRHFERLSDDLGHKHSTLVSLNYGHYFLKEGTYTLIGAEAAQALPNSQVYYAFIRGAGKQYGVPWFGNASVWNRWGHKNMESSGNDFGPTKGTSLSLLKRLLYSHILYNSVAVGFESGWIAKDQLSPIGRIQQLAQRWVRQHGQPGTMQTPVALMVDFYSGWTFPRHLYTGRVYRVWGNLPYDSGDYLTDAVLDMLYPGYQDSSYYHDESGFQVATPYGDIADCLMSDAPAWLLDRYPVLVVAGRLSGGQEIRDKLQAYVEHGGHLVLPESNLALLPGGIAAAGRGRLTVLEGDFAVELKKDLDPAALANKEDQPLAKPYTLRPDARATLDAIFRQQQLFGTESPGLSLIACRKGPGEYTVGVANNGWRELPLKLVSFCGEIQSQEELVLDQAERESPGFTPECVDGKALGQNTATTIAGGDVRIFAVRVKESGVEEIAHQAPAAGPKGRLLPLRKIVSLKEAILARPTFFEHFDGVVIDWRYLHEREAAALERESGWLKRQGVRIYVDLSSGINLFPDLRLVDNDAVEYGASMAAISDVIAKMPKLGSHDLIFRLHRVPENNITDGETYASFDKTLRVLAGQAAERQVTLYFRTSDVNYGSHILDRVGAEHTNLRLAVSLAGAAPAGDVPAKVKERIGLWLLSSQRCDVAGVAWDNWAPLVEATNPDALRSWIALAPDAPAALDAVYDSQDAEYRDAVVLETIAR
jgi:hypothetical protein